MNWGDVNYVYANFMELLTMFLHKGEYEEYVSENYVYEEWQW